MWHFPLTNMIPVSEYECQISHVSIKSWVCIFIRSLEHHIKSLGSLDARGLRGIHYKTKFFFSSSSSQFWSGKPIILTQGPKLFVCLSSYHKVNNWHVNRSIPFNSWYIHILTRLLQVFSILSQQNIYFPKLLYTNWHIMYEGN